jgi:acetolactate synthase I/II/III large subunit
LERIIMRRTGASLAIWALEQIGGRDRFGIPGVQNTELYDELASSKLITPILVAHEAGGAFMQDGPGSGGSHCARRPACLARAASRRVLG